MSQLISQIEALVKTPPTEATARQALYSALQKLMVAVEDPYDTIHRVIGTPKILTFSQVAGDVRFFEQLAESSTPLTVASLAQTSKTDPILTGRILRYLAANNLVTETGEDTFAANAATRTLARPGFRAGIEHAFYTIMPCLQATPQFLASTNYRNPDDVLHSPFQIAHKTDLPAFLWATGQPKLMSDFQLWMSELHDGARTWLDCFDYPRQVQGASADSLVFVDVGGGIGQQCALLKKVHPSIPGRVVLQEQSVVLPSAMEIEGVEKEAYDFWTEQPHKGARIYYLRNILHDYPDEQAIKIIQNHLPALASDSILVIDEIVVPNRGAHMRTVELDTTMMTSLASIERTEKQWMELLDRAGLEIVSISSYNSITGESVIVTQVKNLSTVRD